MEAFNNTDQSTTSADARPMDCFLCNIERISYTKALDFQHELHAKCAAGDIPGILLLLEHDPVFTMGVKTGKGFYDYGGRELTEVLKTRDHYLLKVIQSLQFCLERKRIV